MFPTPADPTRVTVPVSVRGGPLVITPPDPEMAALVHDFRRSGCADDAMDDVPRCIDHPYRVAQRAAAERTADEALAAAYAYAERWEEDTAAVRGVER